MELVILVIVGIFTLVLAYGMLMLFAMNGCLGKRIQLSLGHIHKLDKEHDKRLSSTLDAVDAGVITVREYDNYTITFSDYSQVWIGNKYYGYGSLHVYQGHSKPKDHRARVKTALRVIELEKSLKEVLR